MTKILRFEWEGLIRRVMIPPTVKHVALTLSTYGDTDGTHIYPSVALLARTTCLGERTVRRSLDELRELGLIERVRRGSNFGRQAMSDAYELRMPSNIIELVPMLTPKEESPATLAADSDGTPATVACDDPVENRITPATLAALKQRTPATGAGTPANDDRITGHSGHLPIHDHPLTNEIASHRPPKAGSARARVS